MQGLIRLYKDLVPSILWVPTSVTQMIAFDHCEYPALCRLFATDSSQANTEEDEGEEDAAGMW